MKTVILYRSKHHGNTKQLVDAIAAAHAGDVDTIDVASLGKNEYPDISGYHCVIAASGIYFGEFDKNLKRVLDHCLQAEDKVFGLMTFGGKASHYGRDLKGLCQVKFANLMSFYGCLGFDTWGPFKLAGGVQKGHPTAEEVQGAVDWYDKIEADYGEIFEEQWADRKRRLDYLAENPPGGLFADIKRSAKKIAGKRK